MHGDCWEGLACGPAIEQRWGAPAHELPAEHPAWELEAEYLALGILSIVCVFSPERIILGGGVMQRDGLLETVTARLRELIAGYHAPPARRDRRLSRAAGARRPSRRAGRHRACGGGP